MKRTRPKPTNLIPDQAAEARQLAVRIAKYLAAQNTTDTTFFLPVSDGVGTHCIHVIYYHRKDSPDLLP